MPVFDPFGPSHPVRVALRKSMKEGLAAGRPLREYVEANRKIGMEYGEAGRALSQKWLLEDLELIGVSPEVIAPAIDLILKFLREPTSAPNSAPDLDLQSRQAIAQWAAEAREQLLAANKKREAILDYLRWVDMASLRNDPILQVYPGLFTS